MYFLLPPFSEFFILSLSRENHVSPNSVILNQICSVKLPLPKLNMLFQNPLGLAGNANHKAETETGLCCCFFTF